ncbi:TonB-dependent receptor domain-containing protein [Sphingomonas cavernae]|uniref:TonB-dependent receptor n=1 Tax=Sphingomonas cavernae TaxID=2320861 RepID=A0A418WRB4_9SPHN|nr:TonB-dependent receptor [Sphingomonas cavernae]RJF93794.1 TonB-dependent receptor [Sphingomonas cavernae]
MKRSIFLFTVAPFALLSPAMAHEPSTDADTQVESAATADAGAEARPGNTSQAEVFSTGVAKGRDRLDSATSTSSLRGADIQKIGARSVAEVLRNIPGIRVEASGGDVNNSFTIRGLPLASSGSKYLQLQEDGLPVLEYGDLFVGADVFLRPDFNLNAVETIRGGSASTFASNSPGGVINFMSKTGDVEGGAVQVSSGLDFDEKRLDFDYGSRISDTLRFHVGGFYRTGEGPRETGYTAYKGGQLKLNVTKEFDGGYIRLSGKYLDDRTPTYLSVPMSVSGTNADPNYKDIANFDVNSGSLLSPHVANIVTLDGNNNLARKDLRDGIHAIAKSVGLEAQFDVAGWTITEKFRYADLSGQMTQFQYGLTMPAAALATTFGGPGATLSYATGPNAGQAITDLASLNGNGLLSLAVLRDMELNSLDVMTNDIRATRQWNIGDGVLTTTVGFYKSTQAVDADWLFISGISDVRGDGQGALVDITRAGGIPMTQNGIVAYSGTPGSAAFRRKYDVEFDVTAPYGSLNYMIGKFAIGGSIRYDMGKAEGSLFGADLGGGRVGLMSYDINGDGVISLPERSTAFIPLDRPAPVNFDYEYLSYSAGINYRVAEPLAVFARYSRGGRGAADRVLFTPIVSATTGKLVDDRAGHDTVKQAEAGVKYRKNNLTLNLTGFWAKTQEINQQTVVRPDGSLVPQIIVRGYKAMGAEFEGSIRRGPFSLTAGATYTDAEIASDALNPGIEGNVPRHQPKLIFQATPQFENEMFTVGANFVGTTSSFAQDSNQLKMPGFTVVNAFLQFRPTERMQLSLNANNLFDVTGLTEVAQSTIPANGIVSVRAINGRTISTSLRFNF